MQAKFDTELYRVLEAFFSQKYKSLDEAYDGLKELSKRGLIGPKDAGRILLELNDLADRGFQLCWEEDMEQFYRRVHYAGFFVEERYDYTVMPHGSRLLAYTLGVFKE